MLYLFYGPDQFRVREKIHQIRQKFITQSGNINVETFDGIKIAFGKIEAAICSIGFFSTKRLIVIRDLLKNPDKKLIEKITKLLQNDSKDIELIFWEVDIKRNTVLYNLIKKHGETLCFDLLSGKELIVWIRNQVAKKGGKIDDRAIFRIAELVGSDLWTIDTELEKLICSKGKQIITEQDIDANIIGKINISIFDLIDSIGQKDCQKAAWNLALLFQQGAAELYILTMIIYQFRNMILIQNLKDKYRSSYEIASMAKIHPYVVKKILLQMKNFSKVKLKNIYSKLQKADLYIKTGRIEPRVALDTLVVGLCQ